MDSDNNTRSGPKFDPITGQPVVGNTDPGTTQPSSASPAEPAASTPAPQEYRVAATNGDATPAAPPQEPTYSQPYTAQSSYGQPTEAQPAQYQPYAPPPPTQPQGPGYAPPQYGAQPPYGPPPQQVNVNQPKRSNTPILLGVLALLLIGGGVFTYFMLNRAGIVGGNPAAIERALPANTLGYFQIDPNPSEAQKRAFDRMYEAFASQPGFQDTMNEITEGTASMATNECFQAPEGEGLDAINSYLGDSIAFAVLAPSVDDLDTLRAATEGGGVMPAMSVMGRNVIGIVDLDFNPMNKKGPIADMKKIADEKTQSVENYNGTDIRKYSCGGTTLFFGMLKDTNTAVVAMDTAPIKRIIDEYNSNKGLKDDTSYKFLSGKVPADRVATFYLNMTEIMRYAELMAPEMFAMGTMPKMQGGMLMTLSGQDDGLQFDVASEVKYENLGYNLTMSDKKPEAATLTDIPQDALGFAAGTDLKGLINSALDALEKQDPDQLAEINRQVTENTGLDLRNDILSWMGGDFFVSVSKGQTDDDGPNPTIEFSLKLGGDDRAKAADTLRKLIDKARSEGQVRNVEEFEAGGGTFYNIERVGVAGVTNDRFVVVVMTGGPGRGDVRAALDAFLGNLGKGLGTTDKWKNASRHLPADSNMLMYADVTAIRELAESTMSDSAKARYNESTAPYVRPIKYMLMGVANDDYKENEPIRGHSRFFIGISK